MAKEKLIRYKIIAIMLVILLITVVYFGSQMSYGSIGQVLPGIYVLNINLSNMSREQALVSIRKLEEKFCQPVTLKYKNFSWKLPLDRVNLRIDGQKEIQRAMDIGRTGSLWQKLKERREAYRGIHLKPEISIDSKLLEKLVMGTTENIMLPPRDAGLIINPDNTVEVSPGHSGRLVDMVQLEQDIKQALLQGNQSSIELKLVEVPPNRSTDEVSAMGVDTLLGMFSTEFDPNKVNRAYNVSVAAAALDGLAVSPQELVSFNEVVGPRSTEAGYKTAPIIINNELVDGLGGGVCQVSTTLYNAVLLANLQVVERTNHSLPIPYVPIGRDATVVFELVDFKFKNNTDHWLYIQSYVTGARLTIKIFGNSQFKRDIVIRSWIEETYDPETILEDDYSLKMGDRMVKQKGTQGYKAAAERIVMEDGKVIKVEKLPSSIYKARDKIVSQGMAQIWSMLITPESEETIDQ